MTHEPARSLSSEEFAVLKFAAHRQLARWANKPQLTPHQRAQRTALTRAVRILQDKRFAAGCELHTPTDKQHPDA
jgi:hypothetical protein